MNKNLYEILETCLQELERGAKIEALLAQYPALADELRPILTAAQQAAAIPAAIPSPEITARSRARVLQRAAELREAEFNPRRKIFPSIFQKLAISFALALLFFVSSSGLIRASASSLPGENLYAVKRGWEDMRLLLTFNQQDKASLQSNIEQERVTETNALLMQRRREWVEISGTLTVLEDADYISDVRVLFADPAQRPQTGSLLDVAGWTTGNGYLEAVEVRVLQYPPATLQPEPDKEDRPSPTEDTDENDVQDETEEDDDEISTSEPEEDEDAALDQEEEIEEDQDDDLENEEDEEEDTVIDDDLNSEEDDDPVKEEDDSDQENNDDKPDEGGGGNEDSAEEPDDD